MREGAPLNGVLEELKRFACAWEGPTDAYA